MEGLWSSSDTTVNEYNVFPVQLKKKRQTWWRAPIQESELKQVWISTKYYSANPDKYDTHLAFNNL